MPSVPAVSRPDIWFVRPPLQCILGGHFTWGDGSQGWQLYSHSPIHVQGVMLNSAENFTSGTLQWSTMLVNTLL